jgi:hypothetical protein
MSKETQKERHLAEIQRRAAAHQNAQSHPSGKGKYARKLKARGEWDFDRNQPKTTQSNIFEDLSR